MSAIVAGSHRIKVRVGQSEFEAEGDENTVNEQYRLFLEAIRTAAAVSPPANGGGKPPLRSNSTDELDGIWGQFYELEGDSDVSLKTLPNTDQVNADVLVLLMYGYDKIRNRDAVGGAELLSMGKKSGLRIDRIDRNIPPDYNRYINRGGCRRGLRYSLNNQGKAYAQQLLETEAER